MNTTFHFSSDDSRAFFRFVALIEHCTEHAFSWHKDILGFHIEVCNTDESILPSNMVGLVTITH